ncbi:TPA: replication initiation protein, partial [Salmonella enterica]|nr:replication initiation protein [Salmonella enterica]
ATFRINPKIVEAFLDFSKGFKKYELKIAMEFESVYSMRFYELLSNQKTPINYSVDTLKDLFKVSEKYKRINDFFRYVIEPAKKELDKCSPYTFHYEPIKTGRKITGIRFIPIHQPQFEDESLKKQKALKQMSNRWYIPKNIEDYLKYNYEFTNKELNNNLSLFESLHNHLSEEELLDFLVELKAQSVLYEIKNLKAYLIGSLKHKAEQIFEQKHMKK